MLEELSEVEDMVRRISEMAVNRNKVGQQQAARRLLEAAAALVVALGEM